MVDPLKALKHKAKQMLKHRLEGRKAIIITIMQIHVCIMSVGSLTSPDNFEKGYSGFHCFSEAKTIAAN